jgi:hypothetical protein
MTLAEAEPPEPLVPADPLDAFVSLCGSEVWQRRLADLTERTQDTSLQARAAQQRHALELTIARLCSPRQLARASLAERRILGFAQEAVQLAATLPASARHRLRDRLAAGLSGEATLIPLFHLLRTAAAFRARGFAVRFPGPAGEAAPDLLVSRAGAEAEVVCETLSADAGRPVTRGDWFALVDAINPELQNWLAAHPGRYLLKVTLPEGLAGPDQAALLQQRISSLLAEEKRQDASAQAVLKLDPLVLAGAQAAGQGLPARLRAAFGPEAHLAVTASAGSVFVMAARAGRENDIAEAVTRRAAEAAAVRLSGRRPGILALFIEDLERAEWRSLRETLELEGAVRRFFTTAPARRVVAVSCATRFEMLGAAPPDAVAEGELRFRNPGHPAAKMAGLTPAVISSM